MFKKFLLKYFSLLLPQASSPCGNFSDSSCLNPKRSGGSRGPAFRVCICTANQDQASCYPSAPREVAVTLLLQGRFLSSLSPPQEKWFLKCFRGPLGYPRVIPSSARLNWESDLESFVKHIKSFKTFHQIES